MAITIVLDAGHGGKDGGATYKGRLEKDDNLRLTLKVGEILKSYGYHVIYNRTSDVYESPLEKARKANAAGADYFVSIHRNSSENPNTYGGIQTLVYRDQGVSGDMARNINNRVADLGFRNINVDERKDLVVLKRTQMPAILVEAGFINNDRDNELFDDRFDDLARAIADGINQTLSPSSKEYYVQVGLFRLFANARYQLERLLDLGFDAEIVEKAEYYAVYVGPFATIDQASQMENELKRYGFDTLIITSNI